MYYTEISLHNAAQMFAAADALKTRFIAYNVAFDDYTTTNEDADVDVATLCAAMRCRRDAEKRFWTAFKKLRSFLPVSTSDTFERENLFDVVGKEYTIRSAYSFIMRHVIENARNIMY